MRADTLGGKLSLGAGDYQQPDYMGVSPSKTSWLHAQTVVQLRLAREQFHAPDESTAVEKVYGQQ